MELPTQWLMCGADTSAALRKGLTQLETETVREKEREMNIPPAHSHQHR